MRVCVLRLLVAGWLLGELLWMLWSENVVAAGVVEQGRRPGSEKGWSLGAEAARGGVLAHGPTEHPDVRLINKIQENTV